MLYLLGKTVKTARWNGLPLHEASSAIVKEVVNGDFVLTVRYPITDSGVYRQIREDMLIKAPTPVLGAQLFRIKKPVEHDDYLEITAYHITDDIMKRSIKPVSVVGQGCAMALSQMVQNAKTGPGDFSFTSDIMDSRTFNTTETETLYSVLMDGKHSIVGTWEGELVRDNFALSIKRSRGVDRGVVITTHENLKSYQRTKNSHGVVTRIHVTSTFKEEGAEEETTLRLTVDSPLINAYPYINEKEFENNNLKTIDDLRKWAEAKFKNEGIDKVSDAIEIEAYELDGQVVHLGDTVNLKSRKHSADLYKKAIAYEFDCLANDGKGAYLSLTFDDKPGAGGSGVSSGVSAAAEAILGATKTAEDRAIDKAIANANAAFDAQFDKAKKAIDDGIEEAKAAAEVVKAEIGAEVEAVAREGQTVKQAVEADLAEANSKARAFEEAVRGRVATVEAKANQVADQARQVDQKAAQALTQAGASNVLATEAKRLADEARGTAQTAVQTAKQRASQLQTELDTAKRSITSQARDILAQAQAQSELTMRLQTVETTANGTKATVTELAKTVNTATGNLASVTQRVASTETSLAGVRDQYSQLSQTVSGQTGQITAVTRQTADLQRGLDGVTERFETLKIGTQNLVLNSKINESSNLYGFATRQVNLVAGKTYWFGARAKKTGGTDDKSARVYLAKQGWSEYTWLDFSKTDYEIKWIKHVPKASGLFDIRSYWFPGGGDRSGTADVDWYMVAESDLEPTSWSPAPEDMVTSVDFNRVKETAEIYERVIGRSEGDIQTNVARQVLTSQLYQTEVKSPLADMATRLTQLNDSYAIQVLGSSSRILTEINANASGLRLAGKLIHLDGTVTASDAFFRSVLADKIEAGNIKAGAVTTAKIAAGAVTADHLLVNQAMIDKLVTDSVWADRLFAQSAFMAKLQATKIRAGQIDAGLINTAMLAADAVTADKLVVNQALFTKLTANEAYLRQLFAKQAFITQVQSVDLSASRIKSGILQAINGAMSVNLDSGQILYYTDQAALKRILSGYPTQFIKFATGNVDGKGPAGVTVIGSNRDGSESSNNGGFVGIRAWNGPNVDSLDLVGDEIRLASSAYDSSDGWNVTTLPGRLVIEPHRDVDRTSARIGLGDVRIFYNNTTYVSLVSILDMIFDNFRNLNNNGNYQRNYYANWK